MTMKKIIIAALMAGIMPKMAGAQDIKIKYKGNTATLIGRFTIVAGYADCGQFAQVSHLARGGKYARGKGETGQRTENRHLDGRATGAKKKRLPRAFRTERRQEVGGED